MYEPTCLDLKRLCNSTSINKLSTNLSRACTDFLRQEPVLRVLEVLGKEYLNDISWSTLSFNEVNKRVFDQSV